jgi:hypothetical protein
MSNKKWTEKEDNYIIEQCSAGIIASDIRLEGRTSNAIQSRITLLKNRGSLTKTYSSKAWLDSEVESLLKLKEEGASFSEISILLNRSKRSVESKYYLIKGGKSNQGSFGKSKVYTQTEEELLALVVKYRTRDNMSENRLEGEPSTRTVERYFGSWSNATKLAGIESKYGLKRGTPTILYLVDFQEFKKVGITQRSVEQRFSYGMPYRLLDQVIFDDFSEALEFEKEILSNVELYDPGPPFIGRTECFRGDFELLEDYL